MRLLALVFLAACAAQPFGNSEQLPLLEAARETTMEVALAPPVLGMLRAAVLDAPTTMPLARLIYGKTACRGHNGVNALAILGNNAGPVVGREWRVLFVTSACPSPSEPDWASWIITSTRRADPVNWTPYGMPGCWLLVAPDQIVSVPPTSGGMFLRDGGKTTLRWTPSAASVGATHWFQMIVLSPSGFLASPAVECVVGSTPP